MYVSSFVLWVKNHQLFVRACQILTDFQNYFQMNFPGTWLRVLRNRVAIKDFPMPKVCCYTSEYNIRHIVWIGPALTVSIGAWVCVGALASCAPEFWDCWKIVNNWNLFLIQIFCSETQNLVMTTQHFEKFKDKIKIMSTHNWSCQGVNFFNALINA